MAVNASQHGGGIAVDDRPGGHVVSQYVKPCHPGHSAGEESHSGSDAHWQGKEHVVHGAGMDSLW